MKKSLVALIVLSTIGYFLLSTIQLLTLFSLLNISKISDDLIQFYTVLGYGSLEFIPNIFYFKFAFKFEANDILENDLPRNEKFHPSNISL